MRKVVTGAVVAAALAWAHGASADDRTDAQKQHVQQPGGQSAATAPGRETGMGGTDRTSRDLRSDTRADETARAAAKDEQGPFHGKDNFDVKGRVQEAAADRLTIQRDKLPPATLHVGPSTKVEVDGKRASAAQLTPGQDVKASFNLSGGTAEAVEVKAKKAKEDDRQKMLEQRNENQKDANDRAHDVQRR